jgi:hypothetical protein
MVTIRNISWAAYIFCELDWLQTTFEPAHCRSQWPAKGADGTKIRTSHPSIIGRMRVVSLILRSSILHENEPIQRILLLNIPAVASQIHSNQICWNMQNLTIFKKWNQLLCTGMSQHIAISQISFRRRETRRCGKCGGKSLLMVKRIVVLQFASSVQI